MPLRAMSVIRRAAVPLLAEVQALNLVLLADPQPDGEVHELEKN
jgi:hypothetical protein